MEIDEDNNQQNKAAPKNMFDFDDDGLDKENDINQMNDKDQKKKLPRKPMLKFNAEFLMENPYGLKKLYKSAVIDKEKNLNLKGPGHEISDLRKVMNVYKNWHYEAYPKLEFSYFAERLQKLGTDKNMKAFMPKLRRFYKGDEGALEEFNDLLIKP